jgi:hypothetical protein
MRATCGMSHERVMHTGRARMLHEYRRNMLRDHPLYIYELRPSAEAGP